MDDDMIYEEGKEPYQVSTLTELGNASASLALFIGPIIVALNLFGYFA
jgi:hypothetical protein